MGKNCQSVKHLFSLFAPLLIVVGLLIAVPATQAAVLNGKIAFSSSRDGNYEIYSANPDGSGQTRLTNSPTNFGHPDWSPDGKKIALSSIRDINSLDSFEIYVMNADGTGLKKLSSNPPGFIGDGDPAWSPDGSKIAFTAERKFFDPEIGIELDDSEIYVMNADGSGQRNLTNSSGDSDESPSWSVDGSQIFFQSMRFNQGSEHESIFAEAIYVMNADGSNQRKFVDEIFGFGRLDWSPDGSRIVFASMNSLQDPVPTMNIFSMNADGSGRRNLTNNTASSSADVLPSWSPDGSLITFTSGRDGNAEIYTMNADGGERKNVSQAPGSQELSSTWQPVSKGGAGSDDSATGKGLTFTLSSPKLKRSKTKRIGRKTLYRYLRRGFKGKMTGYKSLRGSLVRVIKRRSKRRSKRKKSRSKRCYKIVRKRTSCKRTLKKGIRLKSRGDSTNFTFKPLGRSKRSLKRLKRGKRIRKGLYNLTFRAKPKSGGKYKTFRYRLRVR